MKVNKQQPPGAGIKPQPPMWHSVVYRSRAGPLQVHENLKLISMTIRLVFQIQLPQAGIEPLNSAPVCSVTLSVWFTVGLEPHNYLWKIQPSREVLLPQIRAEPLTWQSSWRLDCRSLACDHKWDLNPVFLHDKLQITKTYSLQQNRQKDTIIFPKNHMAFFYNIWFPRARTEPRSPAPPQQFSPLSNTLLFI